MKYIIIFENIESYSDDFQATKEWLSLNTATLVKRADFSFITLSDDVEFNQLKKILSSKGIEPTTNNFYVVLHQSALTNQNGMTDQQCNNLFENCQVIIEVHENDYFYYTKMPKLISDEKISFAEVAEGFFPTDEELVLLDNNTEKTKLIYKLIANDAGKETKTMYQRQKEEYENLPEFPAEIDNSFIRNVRDILMDKTF